MSLQDEDFLLPEELQELAQTMNSKYAVTLRDRSFSIEAERKGPGVFVKVILANDTKSFYYPVEARVLFEKEELQPAEAALFLIDFCDSYFEDFLLQEGEEVYLPIDWADFEYEAVSFQMRGQIVNQQLEDLANEWLSSGKDL